jgi:tetrahydromethanopterin S-methyltransferase subunit D
MKHPDPKKHRDLSFIKSGIRIAACLGGIGGSIVFFAAFMMLAEFVGIYEELV